MSLTRRRFSCALIAPSLLAGALGMIVGCGSNPDQTGSGDAGIGAPGKLPDTPIAEESYDEQLKREKAAAKESKSK